MAVFLAFATSGIVFSEPAPTDALLMGLIVLLPAIGLVAISPLLVAYLGLWLTAGACGLLAAALAPDVASSVKFTFVSIYLYLASFVLAAFVARDPRFHVELIFKGWTLAALVATAAGLVGYFSLLPGAEDLFTRFGRLSGTFKDPNVLGPFLVAPFLYALHVALDRPLARMAGPLLIAGVLALAILLSFSRGAWFNLAVALAVYGALALATAEDAARRLRILRLMAGGAALVGLVVLGALQNDRVQELLSQRASLTQSYDVGPDGRFGGQQKAIGLVATNPLGVGALVFGSVHHHEEPHNVYLSMLLNAGWLGGGIYWLFALTTIGLGVAHALRPGPARPLLLIAVAAFSANALEGLIIDLDHWRHVYVLMAIVWGCVSAAGRSLPPLQRRRC